MKLTGMRTDEEGERRGHDGAEDLAGPLQDGLLLAETHDPVSLDVLRDDDRVVDHDADGDDHGEHRHEVQGETGKVVEHGRRREGDGHGEDHGEGRVELAQEEQDDQRDDDGGDEDLPVGRVQGCLDGRRGVVAVGDLVARGELRLCREDS